MTFRNYQSRLLQMLLLSLVLISCNRVEEPVQYASTQAIEREFFSKINSMALAGQELMPSYDYLTTYPAYVIFTDDAGKFERGYLINSAEMTGASVKVDPEETGSLEVFRNDGFFEEATEELEGGLFSFTFDIGGVNHFLLTDNFPESFYFNYKNLNNNFLPLVMAHELFHVYQIENWQASGNWIQDIANYPLDENMIALHLLLFNHMKDAYSATSASDINRYLGYYVAIRAEMIRLDESGDQLITSMGTYQELSEGTARYIEHYSALNSIFPEINADPTHGWGDYLENASTQNALRTALVFRIWYHVGAVVTHMLIENGVDVEAGFRAGNTPYELAAAFLNLSVDDMTAMLEEAKSSGDWPALQERARTLHELP